MEAERLSAHLGLTGTIAVPLERPIPPVHPLSLGSPPGSHVQCPARGWIERQFALFGTIIPAYSGEDMIHRRTSYFYRKTAIAWAQMARDKWPTPSVPALCARLAKEYLAKYRESKRQAPTLSSQAR